MSIGECARSQGFPNSYKLYGIVLDKREYLEGIFEPEKDMVKHGQAITGIEEDRVRTSAESRAAGVVDRHQMPSTTPWKMDTVRPSTTPWKTDTVGISTTVSVFPNIKIALI